MRLEIPRWALPFLQPKRYKVAKGGRGSSKSHTVARLLLRAGRRRRLKILCVREFQISISESVHALLSELIDKYPEFSAHYTVQRNVIIGKNGTQFIFSGIKTNIKKIKSMEGVDICWVEEADAVSKESWDILIPTIRKPGSEIWVTFNPDLETDPTSQKFIIHPNLEQMIVLDVNWRDNPWFPDVLRKEMEWDFKTDPDAAQHVWEGHYRKKTKASVMGDKYIVESFVPQPDWAGPYFGSDWGFSQDPDTLMKVWRSKTRLYVEKEAYGIAIPQNEIPQLWCGTKDRPAIPECRSHVIRADNSRPETIYHVQQMGFPGLVAAEKWPGSVEDGIRWMRQFEAIVIHPSCKHMIQEAKMWSYKVDRLTGDVLPILIDKHNHCWDAVRYAFQPLIKVADEESVVVYDQSDQAIDPDLDEFELRQQLGAW